MAKNLRKVDEITQLTNTKQEKLPRPLKTSLFASPFFNKTLSVCVNEQTHRKKSFFVMDTKNKFLKREPSAS